MNHKQQLPQLTDRFQLPVPEKMVINIQKYGAFVDPPCAYVTVMLPVVYELQPLSEQHAEPQDLVSRKTKIIVIDTPKFNGIYDFSQKHS